MESQSKTPPLKKKKKKNIEKKKKRNPQTRHAVIIQDRRVMFVLKILPSVLLGLTKGSRRHSQCHATSCIHMYLQRTKSKREKWRSP
ncbi:hypothetical protein ACN38_g4203 [Penicillium nordicum]|uniref:Uncharacterized protein n=1 Tax=Penicillium nordicum TaxID=229535 RepID=A0A0M8P720_9EURO|nr:hypothetical protein ACN38_g4203 [Penicillium nordicum]